MLQPHLKWFKNEGNALSCEHFREAFFQFMKATFPDQSMETRYGNIDYMAPDRDNQYIAGYLRPVIYRFADPINNIVDIQFYVEESSEETFKESWAYSFYCFDVIFRSGQNWFSIKEYWDKIATLLKAQGFYDASFSYTYSDCLYDAMKEAGEQGALTYIIQKTEEEILVTFAQNKNRNYIEIQHKPFVNLGRLLSIHPNKAAVKRIQINHNNLTQLPNEIYEFPEVEELFLYHNQIKEIDEKIKSLKKLIAINIHSNPINAEKLKALLPGVHISS